MNYFSGQYDYSVDSKGRINFKKFLKRLSEADRGNPHYHLLKSRIDLGVDQKKFSFFYIFTNSSWQNYYRENKINSLPTQIRTNFMNQRCGEASLDSAERITLPSNFLNFISATKDVIIQGDGERIQVWGKDQFEEYLKLTAESTNDIWSILD